METRWRARMTANAAGMPIANTQSDTTAPGIMSTRSGLAQEMLGSAPRYIRPDASAVHANTSMPLRRSTK